MLFQNTIKILRSTLKSFQKRLAECFKRAIDTFNNTKHLVNSDNIFNIVFVVECIYFDRRQVEKENNHHVKYSSDVKQGETVGRLYASEPTERNDRVGNREYTNENATRNVFIAGREAAQNTERLGQNAQSNQTEQVPTRNTPSDHATKQLRRVDSEPLDARLASESGKTISEQPVSGSVSERSGNGTASFGNNDGNDLSSTARKDGNARDQSSTADSLKDFVITDDDNIGKGGLAKKYRDNAAAIRIIKTLEAENRLATHR